MTPNKKRRIRIVLITILGLLLIGAAVGYYYYNLEKPKPGDVSPDIKITSTELYQAFATDSSAARKKFSGKDEVVQVSGIVSGISTNQDKQTVLLLKTNEEGASVNCTIEGEAKGVKEGDNVKLNGICTGLGTADADLGIKADLYMIRCYLKK